MGYARHGRRLGKFTTCLKYQRHLVRHDRRQPTAPGWDSGAAGSRRTAAAEHCDSLVRRRRLRISRLGEDRATRGKERRPPRDFSSTKFLVQVRGAYSILHWPNHNKPRVSKTITKPKISSKHCCEVLLLTTLVFGLGCLILCIKFLIEYQTRLYGTPSGLF